MENKQDRSIIKGVKGVERVETGLVGHPLEENQSVISPKKVSKKKKNEVWEEDILQGNFFSKITIETSFFYYNQWRSIHQI